MFGKTHLLTIDSSNWFQLKFCHECHAPNQWPIRDGTIMQIYCSQGYISLYFDLELLPQQDCLRWLLFSSKAIMW